MSSLSVGDTDTPLQTCVAEQLTLEPSSPQSVRLGPSWMQGRTQAFAGAAWDSEVKIWFFVYCIKSCKCGDAPFSRKL